MSNNIRQRISELQTTIMTAQNELLKLQSECKHSAYHTEMYMWRVGSMMPSRICNECDASIPGITDEESKAVWDRYNQGTSSGSVTYFYNLSGDTEAVQDISTPSSGT